jgi:predicted nucleotidyltransferase
MDLASPISSVIPSAYGPVLAVLVRAGIPLSGRQLASLVEGQVGHSRVNSVLGELAASGLVLREPHPPTVLYRLNREHVAAPFVEGLANLRQVLLDRIRAELEAWRRPAAAVWLFGSAARGEGSADSDIDILVVRADDLHEDDPAWRAQVSELEDHVRHWSGNPCAVLELSSEELAASVRAGHKLVSELRRDAVLLAGAHPSSVLRQPRVTVTP